MKESDIRPDDIFNEYLRLTAQDVTTYFSKAQTANVTCPACEQEGELAFEKQGFHYCECARCQTLYVNPRPEKAAFDAYYSDSPSTQYWATTFYKETEKSRRELLWKPKAKLVADKIKRFSEVDLVIDIGGGYGTFAEEMKAVSGLPVLVIEPSVHLAQVCRDKGLPVVQKFLEDVVPSDLPAGRKCWVSFELFEHLHEPRLFLNTINRQMGPDDLLMMTTLSGTGLDILALRAHSKSVSPPHHLNFFNPKSWALLLERCGFQVEEVSTPGKLDVNILEKGLPSIDNPFLNRLFRLLSEDQKSNLQHFLTENNLSSHMMVVARKGK